MTGKKITPLKSLSLKVLNNNLASAEFKNLNSLMSSAELIKQLAKANNLNFAESNGNITIYCLDEVQVHKFIECMLQHNKII